MDRSLNILPLIKLHSASHQKNSKSVEGGALLAQTKQTQSVKRLKDIHGKPTHSKLQKQQLLIKDLLDSASQDRLVPSDQYQLGNLNSKLESMKVDDSQQGASQALLKAKNNQDHQLSRISHQSWQATVSSTNIKYHPGNEYQLLDLSR